MIFDWFHHPALNSTFNSSDIRHTALLALSRMTDILFDNGPNNLEQHISKFPNTAPSCDNEHNHEVNDDAFAQPVKSREGKICTYLFLGSVLMNTFL